ncbi:hormogonium polysaccharide biosynthesis glycosyltransferase HpsE [Anabaena sp. WFMT]|uniref:hormogonium polysaccharide biosynthesis glycosyltransferase HpsE n=1 Tax=Anabaena sp. WFMT TaxID=3449730 RepID=UPI003F237704
MSIDFTVVIPTYNGAIRLPEVLEKLRNQREVENISWEIVVVNNNSTDATEKVIQEYQANWNHPVPLRYCFETQQGCSFARQKGVEEAKGELISFLDDDNLPALNWVKSAYTFAQEHPKAGAFGSRIYGAFETKPPAEIQSIIFYLALVDRGSEPLIYEPRKTGLPPGAGLVVRRDVWNQCVPSQLVLLGRAGTSWMATGQDSEALLYIHNGGWEIWYNPAMEIEHVIPSSRLEKTYLMRLMKIIGLGRFYLRMLSLSWWQRPFAFLIYLVSDLCKVILHYFRYREVLNSHVAAAYQMERLKATLISPFYLFRLKISNYLKLL